MTDAERACFYRTRRKVAASHVAYDFRAATDIALMDRLRAAIAAQHQDTAALCIQELARRYP
ncbi:hypothetical protein [Xanthomonas cerealis]|nr:hypothetical protein [Xanthomonas translucens]UKE45603.1 hypothetical protein KHA79_10315 [Xanthomonas translucens pv. cerealis]